MIKKFVLAGCIFIGLCALPRTSFAAHGKNFGLGVILGEPTGFSGKGWLDSTHAVDGALAYSFGSSLTLLSDYLWHFPGLFGSSSQFASALYPYVGVGGVLFISTDDSRSFNRRSDGSTASPRLGVRVPFGVEWLIPKSPVGLSLELVPGMTVIPETDLFFEGGLAARFYF